MLTTEQIESLFIFCRKHFVYYYDVQVELVDHLANAVEAEMKANPKITFEKALEKVHESFGIMGFAPLVAEKEKMAERQSWRLFWNLFKAQFKWSKLLLFFLLTTIMFSTFLINFISIKWCFVTIIIAGCSLDLYQNLKMSRLITKTGKKFLLTGISQSVGFGWMSFYIFYFPNIFNKDFLLNIHSGLLILFISIFLSLFIIMIIAISQTFACIKNTLFKNYPEVFSVAE